MPDRDPSAHGRFRYGPWHGGPDPLAPPYDVRAALDEVGPRRAGRRQPARGAARAAAPRAGRPPRPRRARRPGPPDAQARPAAAATSAAPSTRSGPRSTRRSPPSGTPSPAEDDDDARLAEMELATLPDDVGRRGAGARRLRLALAGGPGDVRVDPADAPARGPRRAVRRDEAGADVRRPRRRCRPSRTCSPTSTRCSPRTPAARTPTDQFREFMDKHGDLFPEQPENVDELIDALARRQAAADADDGLADARSSASSSAQLMSDALADPDLASRDGAALGQPAGAAARAWTAQPGRACAGRASRSATATRSRRWPSWPTSRRSSSSWPRATPARPWTTSTSSGWSSGSAPPRRATCEALRQLERELERQGYLSRGDDGLRLTPRAVRRLGETALKRVFAALDASRPRRPRRPAHRPGRRADRR